MATVKVKFRPSTVCDREGTIYYQVIHKRVARQIKTGYHLYSSEWNGSQIRTGVNQVREPYLRQIAEKIAADLKRLDRVIALLETKPETYTSDDVVEIYHSPSQQSDTLFAFFRSLISLKENNGNIRTAETYMNTLNSFMRFRKGKDLAFSALNEDILIAYEAYLKGEGLSKNTSSFYMRHLRAAYNRAVERGIAPAGNPFRHVYTGVDKTVKRAISLNTLKRIKEMDLIRFPSLDFARDIFLFSFYTRGMAFVDMAYLKKIDIKGRTLSYYRQKTGQQLFIRWENCMQHIVDKYNTGNSPYLLPIITEMWMEERRQYCNKSHMINRNLKKIGDMVGLDMPLTMYVARHTWASVARSKNIPLSVISEGMGHDSETTTKIYLASLDTGILDKANKVIIHSL